MMEQSQKMQAQLTQKQPATSLEAQMTMQPPKKSPELQQLSNAQSDYMRSNGSSDLFNSAVALHQHGMIYQQPQQQTAQAQATSSEDEDFIKRIQERYNQTKDLLSKIQ